MIIIYCPKWVKDYYFINPKIIIDILKNKYNATIITDNSIINIEPFQQYIIINFFCDIPEIYFNKNNIKTLCYIEDIHLPNEWYNSFKNDKLFIETKLFTTSRYNDLIKYDKIIGPYVHLLENYIDKEKLVNFYHFIQPISYIKNNIHNKLLICGTINKDYKLRNILSTIKNSYIHTVNRLNTQNLNTSEWYNLLASYKFVFTDGVTNDMYKNRKYLVCKLFEILYCKSVLVVCDKLVPYLKSQLNLDENIHYISINKDNIETTINLLKYMSSERYNTIVNTTYNIIIKNHTILHREKQLSTIIMNLYNMNCNSFIQMQKKIYDN